MTQAKGDRLRLIECLHDGKGVNTQPKLHTSALAGHIKSKVQKQKSHTVKYNGTPTTNHKPQTTDRNQPTATLSFLNFIALNKKPLCKQRGKTIKNKMKYAF